MVGKKGTASAVFDLEFNKSFNIFQKYYNILKEGKNHSGELLVLFSCLFLVDDSRLGSWLNFKASQHIKTP